jgi:hypothetical protein
MNDILIYTLVKYDLEYCSGQYIFVFKQLSLHIHTHNLQARQVMIKL